MSTPGKVLEPVIVMSAKPANRRALLLNGLFQETKKRCSQLLVVEKTQNFGGSRCRQTSECTGKRYEYSAPPNLGGSGYECYVHSASPESWRIRLRKNFVSFQHLAVERTPKKNSARQFFMGDLRFLRWVFLLLSTVSLSFSTLQEEALAQDTPDYFRQNCLSCHTIGGGQLTGPDLKDLSKRQERPWLIDFMMNPRAVIESGDAYAKKILEESRNVTMPTPPGITRERAEKLLDLIEAESQLEESQFRGLRISTAPFTDTDRSRGHDIFLGTQPLEAGGAACISCHSMHDSPALGGGRLGPDLTNIYERLKGRAALSAWLMAPGTETMQPIFKNHPMSSEEINALAAYFESTTSEQPANSSTGQVAFLLLGLAGAVLGVFFLDVLWKRRFHSVRSSLVQANTSRGKS